MPMILARQTHAHRAYIEKAKRPKGIPAPARMDRSEGYMLIGVRGVMLIGVRRGGVRDIYGYYRSVEYMPDRSEGYIWLIGVRGIDFPPLCFPQFLGLF